MIRIRKIKAKSIITRSNLPDTDYVINPYTGCIHSCLYCYARFMKRFTGHTESWGKFIDVKINGPDLIPEGTSKYEGKTIFMSSVTDPYNPLERKYKLTRRILEKLIQLQPDLGIQTKSDLVLRDIDLLRQFKICQVGMTVTTLDDSLRKEIEPFTSSVQKRIEALGKLKEAGINTYVFIGPILPFFTEWKEIVCGTKNFADSYMFENLNITGAVWGCVRNWLAERHRNLLGEYERIYFTKSGYWDKVEEELKLFCKEQKVDFRIYFHHRNY
ncbi:MAG: radical SAM protein [Candidatus Hydromicrobium sp.]